MNKNLQKKMDKLLTIYVKIGKCMGKNCSQQHKKMLTDKKAANLYNDFSMLKDIERKLKLMNEFTDNKIIYEYEKCVFKHCKKIYNELIKLFRSFVSVIPNTNPKRTELENMITEMEISLNKNTSLTKKEYKMYVKTISTILYYDYNS